MSRIRRGARWMVGASLGVLVVVALAALWVRSTPRPAVATVPAGGASNADLDDFVRDQAATLGLPGIAVVVVKDDVPSYAGLFGVDASGRPVAGDSQFVLGSTSKQFTGLAVQRLISEGRLSLDSKVSEVLPAFAAATGPAAGLTVGRLLSHNSGYSTARGLEQWGWQPDRPNSIQENAATLASDRPDRPPGSGFEYSNANFDLLGAIVEDVTGQPFAEAMRDLVFAPLGLEHTSAAGSLAGQDPGYHTWFGAVSLRTWAPDTPGAVPSSMMTSTADDLTRLVQAHLRPDTATPGPDVLQASRAPLVRVNEYSQYASGWFVRPLWEEHALNADWSDPSLPQCVLHDGRAYRSMSFLLACPEIGFGIVALTDAGAGADPDRWTQFQQDLVHLVLGTESIQLDRDPVQAHAGVVMLGTIAAQAFAVALLVIAVRRRRRVTLWAVLAWTVSIAALWLAWAYAPTVGGSVTPLPALWALIPDLALSTIICTVLAAATLILTITAIARHRSRRDRVDGTTREGVGMTSTVASRTDG